MMKNDLASIQYSTPYQLTPNNFHHFFGYYGICPWSENERYFICLETEFQDHMPGFGETAGILLIDLKENTHRIIGNTRAWNFQQGAMLQWLPSNANRKIIFNDTDGNQVFSRIIDIETGEQRKLPLGINAIGHRTNIAVCLNFSRLRQCRKTVSYPSKLEGKIRSHPSDDGIYIMDLKTGEYELIISYQQIWEAHEKTREMSKIRWFGRKIWFNHPILNPSDSRLFFLSRYRAVLRYLISSMWTIDVNGGNLYCMVDYGKRLSHFSWLSEKEILVTMKFRDGGDRNYVILEDNTQEKRVLGKEKLTRDGHPAISPDSTLLATDTYRNKGKRRILLCDLKKEPLQVAEAASFNANYLSFSQLRCDPHPRWNRSGTQFCYDGLGKNGRQVYVIDIQRT